MKHLKVEHAEQTLLQMGNKACIIHCLLDPHQSNFKHKNKTSHCTSDKNYEDDSRTKYENVESNGNSDEKG